MSGLRFSRETMCVSGCAFRLACARNASRPWALGFNAFGVNSRLSVCRSQRLIIPCTASRIRFRSIRQRRPATAAQPADFTIRMHVIFIWDRVLLTVKSELRRRIGILPVTLPVTNYLPLTNANLDIRLTSDRQDAYPTVQSSRHARQFPGRIDVMSSRSAGRVVPRKFRL